MKSKTIMSLVAAALLSTAVVPAVFAQESGMPEGIEVITILAKRPQSAVASACVGNVKQSEVTASDNNNAGTAGEQAGRPQRHRAGAPCIEQAAAVETGRG